MVSLEYANAYTEVLEILKFISIEDYNKIPKEKLEVFQMNSNKDYLFKYNPEKSLDEQNVSKRAKAIIGLLFRDYWATKEQREKIIKKQNYERQRIEEYKKTLYNVDNIFKKDEVSKYKENTETTTLVKNEKSFIKRCIEKIKVFFKKG